jgi:hypothetical protein
MQCVMKSRGCQSITGDECNMLREVSSGGLVVVFNMGVYLSTATNAVSCRIVFQARLQVAVFFDSTWFELPRR